MGEYDPKTIEPKWQSYWAKNNTFRTTETGKDKVYVLDMFPYPSGSGLHMGHPLGYTATDIYSRFKRMSGFSVLHPMGFDAFGLPAEQHAVATGEHPAVITEKNCETFTSQMKAIGLSYDWDREIATCNAEYYKWTQWIFVKLFNSWFDDESQKARPMSELEVPSDIQAQGGKALEEFRASKRLAYYANAMVNWCPALGTVLANEEVIDGKSERGGHDVVRKPMKQWMLRITKYSERLVSELDEIDWPEAIKEQQRNWIGKRTGTEITFAVDGKDATTVVAFTTRPDTLFGVTFFVLAPEHPLVEEVTSEACRSKVTEYREAASRMSDFDRTFDNRKKTGVFTGGHVVNPASGELIPVYIADYVLASYGTGAVMGVPAHDARDFEFAKNFQIAIRPVLLPQKENAELCKRIENAEVVWAESGVMMPQTQGVGRELALEGKSNKEAANLISNWLERKSIGRRIINYKLRDWLFSRQRYWGEPIPVVHWDDGTSTSVDEEHLPLILPPVEDYKPSDGGESPLAKATEWLQVTDVKTGMRGRRETNTMPQWAGSCWYYLRFIDPHNKTAGWDPALEKRWMPVDLYVGGAEHAVLHLLYARFWHKVLFDLGFVSTREPFKKLYNQGMLLAPAYKDKRGALIPSDLVDEDGQGGFKSRDTNEPVERILAKMSKSLRNVINPDEVIAEFGADTLRTYLMFMGPLDAGRSWDSKAMMGNYRFLKRCWAFVTTNSDTGFRDVVEDASEALEVKKALHKAIQKVGDDIEGLRFNTSISTMMELLNCITDKPVSKKTLDAFTLLLAPLAPHVAEELWQRLGNSSCVSLSPWPSYDLRLVKDDVVTVVIQIGGKKRATVDVAPDIAEQELKACVVNAMAGTAYKVTEADRFITVLIPGTRVPRLVNVLPQ